MDCRTKLENAHRTVFRVLVYPWHPGFGMRVAVHEVVDKADGAVFRGTLSDSRSDRGLEVPAWMFARSCCPDRTHLTEAPFVSAGALESVVCCSRHGVQGVTRICKSPVFWRIQPLSRPEPGRVRCHRRQ